MFISKTCIQRFVDLFSVKSLSVVFLVCLPFSLTAEEEAPALPPLDTAYEAIHPFALIHKNSIIYAYRLSGYEKPHDVQVLYKLSVSDFSLVQLVRDSELITIKPDKFNIQRLMRGEEFTVSAEAFIGDYRNDGFSVYPNVAINFDKLLYAREMKDLSPSSRRQVYEEISYNNKSDRFYVHEVQSAPSYEQVLHVDLSASCLNKFNTSSPVPKENELLYKFINCGTITPLFFNTNIQ